MFAATGKARAMLCLTTFLTFSAKVLAQGARDKGGDAPPFPPGPLPSNLPLVPPPPGEVTDFEHGYSMGHMITAVSWFAFSIASASLLLRLYTRMVIVRAPGWDDWLMLLSWILLVVLCVLTELMVYWGLGKKGWNVHLSDYFPHISLYFTISTAIYSIAMMCAKLSLLFFLRRNFYVIKSFRIAWAIIVTLVVCYSFAGLFFSIFSCSPVKRVWDLTIRGHCADILVLTAFFATHGAFNTFTDFCIFALPMPFLWRLQLPKRQKIFLCFIFALGSLTCAISIYRLYYLIKGHANPVQEITWAVGVATLWSNLELGIAITLSCLTTYRPLIRRHMPWLISTASAGYSGEKQITPPDPREVRAGAGSTDATETQWRTMPEVKH